jgi:hypothetical protein
VVVPHGDVKRHRQYKVQKDADVYAMPKLVRNESDDEEVVVLVLVAGNNTYSH